MTAAEEETFTMRLLADIVIDASALYLQDTSSLLGWSSQGGAYAKQSMYLPDIGLHVPKGSFLYFSGRPAFAVKIMDIPPYDT